MNNNDLEVNITVRSMSWSFGRRFGLVALTILVNGKGHIGGDDFIAADLTELERAVSIHSLHLQDAVVLLALDHCGFVGLLFEHWRVLVYVIHSDVDGSPGGHQSVINKLESDKREWARQ